jgi:hypothetical protein
MMFRQALQANFPEPVTSDAVGAPAEGTLR